MNMGMAVLGQRDGDFRHSHRRAVAGTVENDVFHFLAAERLGALFAKNPGDRVGDIALAATVRADDTGNSGFDDGDICLIRERFEAEELDTFKFQHVGRTLE